MAEIVIDGYDNPITTPPYICRPSLTRTAYVSYPFTSADGTQCIYDMKYGVRNYSTAYLPEYLEEIQHEIETYPAGASLYKAEYLLMLEQEIKQVMAERMVGIG